MDEKHKGPCYWGSNLKWYPKWSIQYKPGGGMGNMERLGLGGKTGWN